MCDLGMYVKTHELEQYEALKAYRAWMVTRDYNELRSVWASHVWNATDIYAASTKPSRYTPRGLHAFKSDLDLKDQYVTGFVYGTVWLFGTVVEFSRGYRAEYAVVEHLERGNLLLSTKAWANLQRKYLLTPTR